MAAPAQASSGPAQQPPGLNGWIQFSWPERNDSRNYVVDGRAGESHQYGAYGLWVTNTTSSSVIEDIRIVLHYLPAPSSWSPSSSSAWSNLSPIGTHTFPEGTHQSYQMTYTGPVTPADGVTNLVNDLRFTGAARVGGSAPSIYIDRYVTVDGVELAFRRRVGTNIYTPLNTNTPPNMPNTPTVPGGRRSSSAAEEFEAVGENAALG
ncbi:hypothetical protein C5B85_07280 [Pseudoclavibacter sp. AY1F1]|uniref:hypothetical protein n=1 Tax=Pseudoclavibacter sp. AY1F1 TaxID=2080583 RepID=UPI000CE8A37C|nr:hypothetical protein [Pseudoclavibacter sp. AY1F1]PPF45374.1 hypothetical protein C5B85_07280 [Pseudoclavibacter sp. AY1F1]